jgi:predicted NodU family carbamoyl transferase
MITLGFNDSQMHDSSASIVRDDELLFAVAEERITRINPDAGFPRLGIALAWILQTSGVLREQEISTRHRGKVNQWRT